MPRISLTLALLALPVFGCGSEPASAPLTAPDATSDSRAQEVGSDVTGDVYEASEASDAGLDVFLDNTTEASCESGYEVDGSCVGCRDDLDCSSIERCENHTCVSREPCSPLQPCVVGACVVGLCRDCPAADSCSPPAGLACFGTYYDGVPVPGPAGWTLRLPDGTELVWDDGRAKSFQELLDEPDLQDTIAIPYSTGPIVPVSTVDFDPGRFRVQRLFEVTYGASEFEVTSHLVSVEFMRNVAGYSVPFHQRAAAALARVSDRLEALLPQDPSLATFLDDPDTFAWRPIANTNRLSAHSFGIAIDTGVSHAYYWAWDPSIVWQNQHPQAIVDAFEAEGFIWGGRWYHYDTMHFEYRPELLDPACK